MSAEDDYNNLSAEEREARDREARLREQEEQAGRRNWRHELLRLMILCDISSASLLMDPGVR